MHNHNKLHNFFCFFTVFAQTDRHTHIQTDTTKNNTCFASMASVQVISLIYYQNTLIFCIYTRYSISHKVSSKLSKSVQTGGVFVVAVIRHRLVTVRFVVVLRCQTYTHLLQRVLGLPDVLRRSIGSSFIHVHHAVQSTPEQQTYANLFRSACSGSNCSCMKSIQ